jgi:hypothetical protein
MSEFCLTSVTLSRTEGSLSKGEFVITLDHTPFHSADQDKREDNMSFRSPVQDSNYYIF